MSLLSVRELQRALAGAVSEPVVVEVLKHKPGRRLTVRAATTRGPVIAKAYASQRAPAVAARVRALAGGPREPRLPTVLHTDAALGFVVLSAVPGRPLGDSVDAEDDRACRAVGAALGRWHRAWHGAPPPVLRSHTVEAELATLADRAAAAPSGISAGVRALARALDRPWARTTVVHRDLYEQQILVADRVDLIDLDNAAAAPPELDVGNLLAHLQLRGARDTTGSAILDGYRQAGGELDDVRLRQCTALARLRLACIHSEPALLTPF
ncbi:MAG TPA: phosphotransferase [Egibacteraceae bacterium]|nr:phosphotransferase [Egibacteraceae bacterium]